MSYANKPIHCENDSLLLRQIIEEIKSCGYDLKRPSPYHLKVGPTNFYPTTGRITIDPTTVHPHKGVAAYLELLEKLTRAETYLRGLDLNTLRETVGSDD